MRIWSYWINKVLFSALGLRESKLGRKASGLDVFIKICLVEEVSWTELIVWLLRW